MSSARKCDRCGNFYEQVYEPKIEELAGSYVFNILNEDVGYITGIRISASGQGTSEILDLCPECRKDFVKFLMKADCVPESEKFDTQNPFEEL